MKKTLLHLVAALSLVSGVYAGPSGLQKTLVSRNANGVAIQGYDPVAYFTDNKAVKGDPRFKSTHEGAIYYFASAAHKQTFDASPARYAPAYGGYCGYAASINRLSPISPEWFQILDGRLVLQHNQRAFDKWNADLQNNLRKADGYWPGLVEQNGVFGGKTLQYLDKKGVALGGYDPVAYFADAKPVPGNPEIEGTFNGALYHFVSQAHREMFEKEPTRYAPAYGGFCGYAASIGKVRPANPLLWSIVDGQLIVQHTPEAAQLWEKDVKGNKAMADAKWPGVVEKKVGKTKVIDPLFRILGVIPVY